MTPWCRVLRVFWHVGQSVEVSHRGDLFNGVFVLVELAGFFIQHTICIEAEMLDHERVHRLALDILVAVFFIREVGVLRLGLCVVVFVDRPDERVLNLRRVFCPVATHGNELERARAARAANSVLFVSNLGVLWIGRPLSQLQPPKK